MRSLTLRLTKRKAEISLAPSIVSPELNEPFYRRIGASQAAVGRTLTQCDEKGKYRVIAFSQMNLSPSEFNYTTKSPERFDLIRFLNLFRCYL